MALVRRSLLACGLGLAVSASRLRGETAPLRVVASFSILADLVRQVGGDRVEVTALVGPNGDAHVFNPSPADAGSLAGAALVVVNGLGFEGWINRLIRAAAPNVPVVVASNGVRPIEEHGHAAGPGAAGHAHRLDPHAWQSLANARLYVANIRDGLARLDPAGAEAYAARAAAYDGRLAAFEAELRASIAAIPPERRRIITSHDAFSYFARDYGVTVIAPQGVSTEAEPSARSVAAIIRQIRRDNITAVFIESMADRRLIERIAAETGVRIGGKLYADALSEADGPAATYLAMMQANLRALTAALAP